MKNDFVKKDVYTAKIKNIEDKIPDITNVATNTILNAKVNKILKEILNINNLATTDAITTVENKIPNVSNLVKKAYYDEKLSKLENTYFTISDYNNFTSNIPDVKITRKRLINEKKLNKKIKVLAAKVELKAKQEKIVNFSYMI